MKYYYKYFVVFVSNYNEKNKLDLNHKIDPIISLNLITGVHTYKDICPIHSRRYNAKKLLGYELPIGMYLIPFCLEPKNNNPTGQMNFHMIDHVSIKLTFPPNHEGKYNVKVGTCSTTFVRICNGMYSN